jgi:hypothetical protein
VSPSAAAAQRAQAAQRRRLGLGLIAFGAAGLVLIIAAGALVLASLGAVDDAATEFDVHRVEILAILSSSKAALESAASTAGNAGPSLAETRDAASQAAELMTRLATAFERLAALGSFEILGSKPFAAISSEFGDVADQSRTLSDDLAEAATSMDTNITDSEAVAADLAVVVEQLDALEASLGGGGTQEGLPPTTPSATDGLPIDAARFVLAGLLLWLAIPAVASVWIGWRWSRAAPGA